jgi:radical SAM superfamily enzyme YgiQ (UPF0313 family)
VRDWLNPDIEIRIVDMRAARLTLKQLSTLFGRFEPDVVGFSSMSCEHQVLVDALKRCKAWNPDCLTVVGGPHASMFADLLAANPDIDVLVRGEGEHTFVELLKVWADGGGFHDVKGVVFAENDGVVETPPRSHEEDLDSLPLPAWDLLDIPSFSRTTNMNTHLAAAPYAAVTTSRGCPYRCSYCHRLFGTRFRERSVENVLEELEILQHRFGVREVHFVDDCFNLKKARAMQIADEILSRGLRFKIAFPNGVRGDLMDDDLIEMLGSAGTYSITYAVETASERLQKLINKNLRLDKVAAAIETTYKLGVIPAAFLMLGLPTETREEMEKTIRFACDSKILKAYFFTAVPFPRTELYEIARITYPDMALRVDNISETTDYLSPDPFYTRATGIDIEAVQRSAYRRFYFDPVRIARILRRFPMNIQILRGVLHGFQASFKLVEDLGKRLSP